MPIRLACKIRSQEEKPLCGIGVDLGAVVDKFPISSFLLSQRRAIRSGRQAGSAFNVKAVVRSGHRQGRRWACAGYRLAVRTPRCR